MVKTKKPKPNGKEKADALYKRAIDIHAKLNEKKYEYSTFEISSIQINDIGWNGRTQRPVQNLVVEIDGEERTYAIEEPNLLEKVLDAIEEYVNGEEDATVDLPVRSVKGELATEGTIWIQ